MVINSSDYTSITLLFEIDTCIASTLQNVITSYPSALAQNQGTTTAL